MRMGLSVPGDTRGTRFRRLEPPGLDPSNPNDKRSIRRRWRGPGVGPSAGSVPGPSPTSGRARDWSPAVDRRCGGSPNWDVTTSPSITVPGRAIPEWWAMSVTPDPPASPVWSTASPGGLGKPKLRRCVRQPPVLRERRRHRARFRERTRRRHRRPGRGDSARYGARAPIPIHLGSRPGG